MAMMSLFVAISVWGQSEQKIIVDDNRYQYQRFAATLPEFSYQGKTSLFVYEYPWLNGEEAEGQSTNITFYDENLNPGKSIQIPVNATTTYQEVKEVKTVATLSYFNSYRVYDYNNDVSSFTIETAKAYIAECGYIIRSQETKEDSTYFYIRFYEEYRYGMAYPNEYYWLKPDGSLYRVDCDYYNVGFGDEWVNREREESGKAYTTLFPMGYRNYDEGNACYDNNIYISQTLFNDDEKYEYIVPFADESVSSMWWNDRNNDGTIDYYNKNYGEPVAGFNVVSEDGSILHTVKYDNDFVAEEYNMYYKDICCDVIKINGKIYIEVRGFVINENDYTQKNAILIFALDKETNSIRKVAKHVGMNVRPAIADRCEPITVELGDDSVNEIIVSNAAGQIVKRVPVSAGQRQVSFSSQGLSRGLNVINANGKNGKSNCKVIVK